MPLKNRNFIIFLAFCCYGAKRLQYKTNRALRLQNVFFLIRKGRFFTEKYMKFFFIKCFDLS